jgi:hypothetical protein
VLQLLLVWSYCSVLESVRGCSRAAASCEALRNDLALQAGGAFPDITDEYVAHCGMT